MATKKDLIEAQGFSQRRLLTAFTSGAPGGKELDPAKPLRAVAAGITLAAMLVLGGVFYGLIRPGLPDGWENNRLILASDTGARYISVEGVLYPVINTASARLLMPAGEFSVITTDQGSLADIEIGPSIGIVGAPDDLPQPDALVGDGWAACVVEDERTSIEVNPRRLLTPSSEAVVAQRGEDLFVVSDGRRYPVPQDSADPVLRAVGLDTATPVEVEGRWLNLFEPGAPLEPLVVAGAGSAVGGSEARVGDVVHPEGSPEDERYLMTEDGELAPLSALAYQLYLLGTGATADDVLEFSPAELAELPTAPQRAGGDDWPSESLTPWSQDAGPVCALLLDEGDAPQTVLGSLVGGREPANEDGGVSVAVGSGALVSAGGEGDQAAGTVHVIDETGTAFPLGSGADIVQRLGYDDGDVARIPEAWLQFFPLGPVLSPETAGQTTEPAPSDDSEDASGDAGADGSGADDSGADGSAGE